MLLLIHVLYAVIHPDKEVARYIIFDCGPFFFFNLKNVLEKKERKDA